MRRAPVVLTVAVRTHEAEEREMGPAETQTAFRELAHRVTDGIEVSLLWESGVNRLTVSVFDERSGDVFQLEADPKRALEMFKHPYAYAAFTGVPIHAHEFARAA
jgi:hypothetical protein